MGVITIEIPQKVKRSFHIDSKAKAREILKSLDDINSLRHGIDPNGSKKASVDEFDAALDAVVGMWSYREKSTQEIANELRDGWNRTNGRHLG
ncbi:MAG: hypothetical protein IPM59_13980 [Chloracidobacterium sp.]|nr:hypothetical protein [Chloracidobacterium sp.]